MNRQLTAIVEREGDGYVALCPEVDVASQGDTVAEARDNLAEALTLFFETAPAEEVSRRLRSEVYVYRRSRSLLARVCDWSSRLTSSSDVAKRLRKVNRTKNRKIAGRE